MMTGKCVYCKNGYRKRRDEPCRDCRNNPYDGRRLSAKRPDRFEKGDAPEMDVEGVYTWEQA